MTVEKSPLPELPKNAPKIGSTWFWRDGYKGVLSGVVVRIDAKDADLSHQDGTSIVPLSILRESYSDAAQAPAVWIVEPRPAEPAAEAPEEDETPWIAISDEGDQCLVKRFDSQDAAIGYAKEIAEGSAGNVGCVIMPAPVAFFAPELLSTLQSLVFAEGRKEITLGFLSCATHHWIAKATSKPAPTPPAIPNQSSAAHLATLSRMSSLGGSFVNALAQAWRRADGDNHARLFLTFNFYYEKYSRMGGEA